MTARIIDGKSIAAELSEKIAAAAKRMTAEHGIEPGLAVVLVGDNPASEIYVRSKTAKTAAKPPVPSQKPVASALAQDTTQTANAPASGATTTPTP